MKRIIIGFPFVMLSLVSFLAVPAMATPMANLTLVNSPIAIDDTFQVEVWADGDNIGSFVFRV